MRGRNKANIEQKKIILEYVGKTAISYLKGTEQLSVYK